jgi:conjugal transfer pilus assembly protein TraB
MAFRERIKSFWDSLSPKAKQKVVLLTVVGMILVVSVAGYWIRSGSPPPAKQAGGKREDVALDPKLLEKSMYMEGQKEIAKRDEKIAALSKQIDDIVNEKKEKDEKEQGNAAQGQNSQNGQKGESGKVTSRKTGKSDERLPDLPLPAPPGAAAGGLTGGRQPAYASFAKVPPPSGAAGMGQPVTGQPYQSASPGTPARPDTFGEIEIVSSRDIRNGKEGKEESGDKKKEQGDRIYLPPSFMAATLLSGLDAPTSEGAKGNPAPVFIRIKELAILPNRVKANLKGCFVIAEGHGNLATERAELRLVSLSCLDRKDHAVIDQKIKGFVVDSDGKIGLKGTVVSKMGSAVARSLIAGFFGGIGDAFRQSATTQAVSALGATQIVDPSKVVRSAIGGGVSTAATELQKFYLELAKQTMPVIEVGATKNITVIVSEGTDLAVKEIRQGKSGRKYEDEI